MNNRKIAQLETRLAFLNEAIQLQREQINLPATPSPEMRERYALLLNWAEDLAKELEIANHPTFNALKLSTYNIF